MMRTDTITRKDWIECVVLLAVTLAVLFVH